MMNSRSDRQRDVGFKFDPTDEELVLGYLLNKLQGKPPPTDEYVKDYDLYAEEPWKIWEKFRVHPACRSRFWCEDDEEDLYVFTPLKKRTAGGKKIGRRVGSGGGYWHGEDAGKVSWSSDRRICWIMKRFKYMTGSRGVGARKSDDDGWIMHEYSLHKPVPWLGLDASLCNSYALCRIRKKEEKKRKADDAQGKPKVYFSEIDDDDDEVKREGKEIVIGGGESILFHQQERPLPLSLAGGGATAASPVSSVGSAAAASPEFFYSEIQTLLSLMKSNASSSIDHPRPILCEEEQWGPLRKAIRMDFDCEKLC